MHAHEHATAVAEHPSCPFCKSNEIKTTSEAGRASTYWRCTACGEIWNPLSLPAAPTRRWLGSR